MKRNDLLRWRSPLLLPCCRMLFFVSSTLLAQNIPVAPLVGSSAVIATGNMLYFSLAVSSDWPFWDTGIGLRPGDLVEVSGKTGGPCNPSGVASREDILQDLPLAGGGFGALIGRLGDGEPFLIGQHLVMNIQNVTQLFLGVNTDGERVCSSTYEVQVSIRSAADLSKLHSELVAQLDRLPRRSDDGAGHPGDVLNFLLIGPEKTVAAAVASEHWVRADERKLHAAVHAVFYTWAREDYLQMPMSKLYCFGRSQDFGYELAQPYKVVASRHHFRLWRVPWQFEGKDLWIGAATHDVGFAKDHRNGHLTHKIDPNVDEERDFILRGLDAGAIDARFYFTPQDAVVDGHNATGDPFHSDGRVLVISLK